MHSSHCACLCKPLFLGLLLLSMDSQAKPLLELYSLSINTHPYTKQLRKELRSCVQFGAHESEFHLVLFDTLTSTTIDRPSRGVTEHFTTVKSAARLTHGAETVLLVLPLDPDPAVTAELICGAIIRWRRYAAGKA